ncbi:MAG: tetratricopeptide repeat protein [Pirellulaceae bacterium]|nr:tetratricopeptide repeat protein [Pirellulaceae bacterium]
MAEQFEPVKRLVAIKLIKPGLNSREVLARFSAEQQALALLDHPNIARILDGGVDEFNQPFFAMELVKGVPITRYCDELRLGTRERLELFIPICQAIQHAHQKGLIHRDLKPSNILIAKYDNVAIPKVIDFGVAKAIGTELTVETLHTGFSSIVGTLEYMSPEQAQFNNRDIDTRADIYSLGVILYELLVGSPPFHRTELARLAIDEVLKVIREVDPKRPSDKLSSSEMRASVAAVRNSEPDRLARSLRNDLDWVVMKSLEKDRSRRYATSIELGSDIQRFLMGETVQAAPPSALYRAQKWLRRNRTLTIAASLVLISLLVGLAGTLIGLLKANQALEYAESKAAEALEASEQSEKSAALAQQAVGDTQAFADHLVNGFLKAARPEDWNGGLGVNVTMREALLLAENKLPNLVREHPNAELIARQAHAETWFDLGEYRREETNWRRVLELLLAGSKSERMSTEEFLFEARTQVGMCLLRQSQLDDARKWFDQAFENFAVSDDQRASLTWLAHIGLGEIDLAELRPQRTLDRLLPILHQADVNSSPDNSELFAEIGSLVSSAHKALGKTDEAIELNNRLLDFAEDNLGDEHLFTLLMRNDLAHTYWTQKQYDKSIPIFCELSESARKLLGDDHPTALQMEFNLAVNLSDSGKPADAEPMFVELLPKLSAKLGDFHEKTLQARKWIGHTMLKQKRFVEAQDALLSVWQAATLELGADHAESLDALSQYCESLQQAGKLEEAIPFRENLLTLRRKQADRHDPKLLPNMNNLASLYWRTGKLGKSVPMFRDVVELCTVRFGPDDRRTVQASANLAANLRDSGQIEEAISLMEQVCRRAENHTGLEWTEDELVTMYLFAERSQEAQPLLVKQEKRLRAELTRIEEWANSSPLAVANRQAGLANNLIYQLNFAEAKTLIQEAIAIIEEFKPESWQLAHAQGILADILVQEAMALDRESDDSNSLLQEAERLLLPSVEILTQSLATNQSLSNYQVQTKKRLQRLYEVWEKPEEAAKWK